MFFQYNGTEKKVPVGGRRRAERAFALPVAMMVTIVVIVLGIAFIEVGRMDGVGAVRDVQDMQALAAAECGLARACAMSTSQKLPWHFMTYDGLSLAFAPNGDPTYLGHDCCDLFAGHPVGGPADASYSVVIEDIASSLPATGRYRIHSFGAAGSRSHHVTVDASTVTFASFGWLTNSENNIYFATGDMVDGWVYTNDYIHVFGKPTFTGKVNSGKDSVKYWHGGPPSDIPDFQKGIFFNSSGIDIQSLLVGGHVAFVRTPAMEPTGIHLPSNSGRPYNVVFGSDGTVTIDRLNADDEWEPVIENKALSTTNGAIYIEETIQLSGVLNGEVTLATPQGKDIMIIDDLVYAYPPDPHDAWDDDFDLFDPAFDDKLAIVSGGDIIVKKEWNDSWTRIHIMASLVALDESFKNEHYNNVKEKGLFVLGGIVQETRAAVGSVGGGSRKGFVKDYKFDSRFMHDPPLYFPIITYQYHTWSLNP